MVGRFASSRTVSTEPRHRSSPVTRCVRERTPESIGAADTGVSPDDRAPAEMSAVSTEVLLSKETAAPAEAGRPNRWFTMEGRCGVLAYNGRFVLMALIVVLVAFGGALVAGFSGGFTESGEPSDAMMTVLALAFAGGVLVMLPVGFFAAMQRLHDLNMKGWFVLLAIVPVVGTVFSFYIALAPGKRSANRFGEWRAASRLEKVFGVIGLALGVLMLCALIAMVATGNLELGSL